MMGHYTTRARNYRFAGGEFKTFQTTTAWVPLTLDDHDSSFDGLLRIENTGGIYL